MSKRITDLLAAETEWISLGNGVRCKKAHGIVFVDCYISGQKTITTTYQTLATLPEGFRPKGSIIYTTAGTNSANAGVAYAATDGAIGAKTFSGTTQYMWFQFSFPA